MTEVYYSFFDNRAMSSTFYHVIFMMSFWLLVVSSQKVDSNNDFIDQINDLSLMEDEYKEMVKSYFDDEDIVQNKRDFYRTMFEKTLQKLRSKNDYATTMKRETQHQETKNIPIHLLYEKEFPQLRPGKREYLGNSALSRANQNQQQIRSLKFPQLRPGKRDIGESDIIKAFSNAIVTDKKGMPIPRPGKRRAVPLKRRVD